MTRSSRELRRRRQSAPDSVGSSSTPVHKQSWFVGLVAIVGLGGTLTGIAAGWFGIIRPLLEPKPFEQNTEIVIDRSSGMRQKFDDPSTTKQKAAADAITTLLKQLVPNSDNLALREFGGDCDKQSVLSVPFKPNNHDGILDAVEKLEPDGKATLTRAIRDAVDDFSDLKRFENRRKQIIVIVGNEDPCIPKDAAANIISQLLEQRKIQPSFYYIGVGLSGAASEDLSKLAEATNGTVIVASTKQELQDGIYGLLAASTRAAKSVFDILNENVDNLDPLISSIQREEYIAADAYLLTVIRKFYESETQFVERINKYNDQRFNEIYKVAQTVHDIQRELLDIAKKILEDHRLGHQAEVKNNIDKFGRKKAEYNAILTAFYQKKDK